MEAPRTFRGKKTWNSALSRQMPQESEALDNEGIARRLRILRYSVAGGEQGAQSRFAAQMGIEAKRWNNFERGYPLPRDMAVRLVRRNPGLTTDWLWLGIEDGMPGRLQRELAEAGNGLMAAEGLESAGARSARKSVTKSRA